MKQFALPFIALAVAACSRDAATAPPQLTAGAVSTLSLAASVGDSDELSSIETRFLPGFDDQTAAAEIRTYIRDLRAQIAAGNNADAIRLIDLAREALKPGVTSAAEIDAINRTLSLYQRDLQ